MYNISSGGKGTHGFRVPPVTAAQWARKLTKIRAKKKKTREIK